MKQCSTVHIVLCVGLFAAGVSAVPVSRTDLAVYAEGKLKIQDTVHGDVGSKGALNLKKGANIYGDVASGQDVKVGSGVAVAGTVAAGGLVKVGKGSALGGSSPGSQVSFSGGTLARSSFSSGGQSYKSKGEALHLDAGSYGSVKLKGSPGQGGLHLSGGDYFFDALSLKGADIHVDVTDGPVNVYVTGSTKMTGISVKTIGALTSAEAAGQIFMEVHGKAKIGNSDWLGTIYTPDGKLQVKSSDITGALYSGGDLIISKGGQSILYAPLAGPLADWDGGPPTSTGGFTSAPEPKTQVLFVTGLVGLVAFRRKRLHPVLARLYRALGFAARPAPPPE